MLGLAAVARRRKALKDTSHMREVPKDVQLSRAGALFHIYTRVMKGYELSVLRVKLVSARLMT